MADYSRPYTDEDAKFDKRAEKLQRHVRKLKVSKLTVGELLQIIEVFRPSYEHHRFSEADAQVLERILGERK